MFNTLGNSIPRNGLVGEWLLDGNALDTASTNNGTATNVTWVKTDRGYQSQAGSFNGSSSFITSAATGLVTGSGNREINIICKFNVLQFGCLFEYGTDTSGGRFGIFVNASGDIGLHGNGGQVYTLGAVTTGKWYSISFSLNGTTLNDLKIYIDGVLKTNAAITGSSVVNTASGTAVFGRFLGGSVYFNGIMQSVRVYNRVLSDNERQLLYLEGLRKLGPTATPKYPSLLSGLVGYFRAEDTGGTALYNLVNGIAATRVGGTNTADNLGINKAILNPNYTWASLTYTTGYTFENSGSGWSLVTTPSGLSATGINRTTTLRDVFLFNRTLSTDEINLLESLCNSEYPYPTPSYDIASLRDGLVLDLNEQGFDLSSQGNNGTLVNSPAVVRQGRAKGLSYNGSTQSLETATGRNIALTNFTFNCWIKPTSIPAGSDFGEILGVFNSSAQYIIWLMLYQQKYYTLQGVGGANGVIQPTSPIPIAGTAEMITVVGSTTAITLYRNGVQIGTAGSGSFSGTADQIKIGKGKYVGFIGQPKMYNKALSQKEIEQLYYSQKANFIY